MKIGFTGAAGFVGRTMVRRFLNAGHEIVAVIRSASDRDMLPEGSVRFIDGDILIPQTLQAAFDGCDVVVNLVGIIREMGQATFQAVHVQGTLNTVQAARKAGVRRFVQMSAAGTRGDAQSMYHKTKWEAEEAVRSSGLEWVILRPSLIFGVGDGMTSMLIDLIHKAPVVPVVGPGTSLCQPISVEDVAACFQMAAEQDIHNGRTYEIGGPEQLPFKDVVGLIRRQIGSHKPTVHLPLFAMLPLTKVMNKFMPRFPITPDQLIMLQEDNVAEPNAALEVFHLNLSTFQDGLKRILAAQPS